MTTVFVKPVAGALVRFPDTMTPLSTDGAHVEFNKFWRRRVADGTVVVVAEETPPAPAPKETAFHEHEDESARSDRRRRG